MDFMNKYFKGLEFIRTHEKKGFVIYAAAIHSFIGGDKQRYVLAFVPSHLAIKNKAKLRELPWVNLQTRLCAKNTYNTMPQQWVLNDKLENITLKVLRRFKTYTTYTHGSDFPFEVLLINNSKNKSIYQYPENINLHWAIDKFNTCFNYTGHIAPLESTLLKEDPSYELVRF